jgi:hypothetical protein
MKTKKPKDSNKATPIFSEKELSKMDTPQDTSQATPPVTDSKPTPTGGVRRSIAWYEDDKGKIDLDKMQERTRTAFKEFLSRPDVWKTFDVEKPAGAQKVLVGKDLVERVYEFMGQGIAFMAARSGVTKEQAEMIFVYDREELDALVPVTVRLINKRGPDWLTQWNEEIEFGITFISIQVSKFFMLRALIINMEKQKKKNAPPPPPTSILVPDKPEMESTEPPKVPQSLEDIQENIGTIET